MQTKLLYHGLLARTYCTQPLQDSVKGLPLSAHQAVEQAVVAGGITIRCVLDKCCVKLQCTSCIRQFNNTTARSAQKHKLVKDQTKRLNALVRSNTRMLKSQIRVCKLLAASSFTPKAVRAVCGLAASS